jgi:putative transposase
MKPKPVAAAPVRALGKLSWPHAPLHQLSASGTYFLTAGTYGKEHYFRGANRLAVLQRGLLRVAFDFGWQLEVWAVFSNHYHFVAHSPPADENAESLSEMLGLLHEKTAKWINRIDGAPGRQVWHNFWETRLTFEKSYLARLNYVHQNPVRHKVVLLANQYPWCSAGWFERTARPAQVKTIYGFKTDKLKIYDEYETESEW